MRNTLVAFLVAVAAPCVFADASVPYTFSAGSPAKAADVNANFTALVNAINAVGARVSKLEGQITQADLAGTYSIQRFQAELGGDPGSHVAVYVAGGTLTLVADGTGTFIGPAETGTQLNVQTRSVAPFTGAGGSSGPITWSYSGGVVNMLGGTLAVVAGGRLLIKVGSTSSDGTAHVMLLTRTN
ncbi:MAG: hypothetical protein JWQ07_332 [Ramlibacter sp.]|nr:hypothetical protein [Ramlibacter sp.]